MQKLKTMIFLCALGMIPSGLLAENYHVLSMREDGRVADVVFHIPIPDENNGIGIPLRTAISECIKPRNDNGAFGVFESRLPDIDAAELTKLRAGELFEYAETVSFLAADTNGQKQAKIDGRYTALTTRGLANIRASLMFWGLDRDVP